MNPDHTPRPHNSPHSAPINTGANWPAYPHAEHNGDGTHYHDHHGLTKRELFAAMAMQGLLSRSRQTDFSHLPREMRFADAIALESAAFADALLAELAKDGAP